MIWYQRRSDLVSQISHWSDHLYYNALVLLSSTLPTAMHAYQLVCRCTYFETNYIDTRTQLFSFLCITKNRNLRPTRNNLDGGRLSYMYIIPYFLGHFRHKKELGKNWETWAIWNFTWHVGNILQAETLTKWFCLYSNHKERGQSVHIPHIPVSRALSTAAFCQSHLHYNLPAAIHQVQKGSYNSLFLVISQWKNPKFLRVFEEF